MGVYRFRPPASSRMGMLWTLSTIRGAALVEFGCMGHLMYGGLALKQSGVYDGCQLYSTHISETDISMGDTRRVDRVVRRVIEEQAPEAIFLLPSSVPEIIGIDLSAVARRLQCEHPGTPIIAFSCDSFDDTYHQGIESALKTLVTHLTEAVSTPCDTGYNIVGSCADLLYFQEDVAEIQRIMEGAFGMKPICILSSETDVSDIRRMGGAALNIVLRREGSAAAVALKKRFATPYVIGRPYGVEGTVEWLEQISRTLKRIPDVSFVARERREYEGRTERARLHMQRTVRICPGEATLTLGGHVDVVKGVRQYAREEMGFPIGTCWCDSAAMAEADVPYFSEAQWSEVVSAHREGWLMASGEALKWAGKPVDLQLANPDIRWRLCPYGAPLVGFRGALHLVDLWMYTMEEGADG